MSELFCERLKRLRLERGFSQKALAMRSGIQKSGIVRFEHGENKPHVDSLKALARAFGVSVDYLLTGRETSQTAALHAAIRRGESRERLLAMIGPLP